MEQGSYDHVPLMPWGVLVLCQEFETKVVAAYIEAETAKQAALSARRLREARASWAHLIQSVRTRLQLRGRYEGAAPEAADSAEGLARPSDGRAGKEGETRG